MPYRRLPNTDQARVRALKAAVEKGDVYNVRDLAISLKTLFEARNFLQRFEAAQIYYTQCYENQSRASRKHQANVKTARLYISHFIQVLNLAVLRDEIKAVHKKLYDLPDANVVPDLLSEASLVEWGKKIIEGEQRRDKRDKNDTHSRPNGVSYAYRNALQYDTQAIESRRVPQNGQYGRNEFGKLFALFQERSGYSFKNDSQKQDKVSFHLSTFIF